MEFCQRYSTKWYLRFWFQKSAIAPLMLVALIVVASSATVVAQEIGDVDAGQEYAALHCSRCHAIDDNDMYSANPQAPPFGEIARTPGMNGRALTVWLSSVHKNMPDLIIEKNDMEDVIAYIRSLATNKRSRR